MLENFIKEFYGKATLGKAVGFTLLFYAFKLLFPYQNDFLFLLINETLAIHAVYFWLYSSREKLRLSKKKIISNYNQLIFAQIVLLVLAGAIYFILKKFNLKEFVLFNEALTLIEVSLILIPVLFSFIILSKFFFYRQKGNPNGYYRALLLLILFSGLLSAVLSVINSDADLKALLSPFVSWLDSFSTIVDIALVSIIVINSFRVSWIAKLTKKGKIGLIFRSLFASLLFLASAILLYQDGLIGDEIRRFSFFVYAFVFSAVLYGIIYSTIIFFTTIFHLPTAEESDKQSEELSRLWNFGKMLNRILDIGELAETIVSLASQAGNSQFVWLQIFGEENKIFTTGKINSEDAKKITSVILKNKNPGRTEVVDLTEVSQAAVLTDLKIERALVAPLVVKKEIKGYLFLARLFGEEGFDEDEITSVSGLADYASLAIKNAELLKASIEKERMEKELELARAIQQKIIPANLPQLEGYEIASQFIPAFEVGGDYYDFFNLNGNAAFVIADVSGKGIEASYVMAEMKGVFEAFALSDEKIEELLKKANEIFRRRLKRSSFVTAVVGVIKNDELIYYRLGHNKPILVDENGAHFLESSGVAFGMAENEKFSEFLERKSVKLKSGDFIAFYTDGVNESMNAEKEEFGYARLFEILEENKSKSAPDISASVIKSLSMFAKNNIQNDDITLLIIKKK